jgi:hypothetical protein
MSDASAVRESFLLAQIEQLEPLAFIVVGLPQPPFDALQARREEDDTFVVEIASRDASSPFLSAQTNRLAELGFTEEGDTWVGKALATPRATADLLEQVLTTVLDVAPDAPVDVRHGTLRDERAAAAKLATMRLFIEPVLEQVIGSLSVGTTTSSPASRAWAARCTSTSRSSA